MLMSPAFLIPLLAAAVLDIGWRRIPNWLTAGLALLFLPAAWLAGLALPDVGWHLLAGAIFLGIGIGLHALGIMGGGDAKLAAAIALWVGISDLLLFVVLTAACGGLLALIYVIMRAVTGRPGITLPYGVAIAAAGFLLALRHLTLN